MEMNLLYKFFKGDASEKERQEVKAWVTASEENRKQFFQQRKLFDLLALLPEDVEPKQEKRKHWLRDLRNIAAAVIFTLLCTSVGFGIYQNKADRLARSLVQTINVPVGQHITVSLPDGTDVCLNSGTTLTYHPADFGRKGVRRVSLDGEGFFDVAHDESRPFVVETYYMDVKALGTEFNVYAHESDNIFETTLFEGRVVVDDKSERRIAELAPDYKIELMPSGELMQIRIDDYDDYRWREGLFCFKSKNLKEILNQLDRYYDTKLQLTGDKYDKLRLTGKFRLKDGINSILSILQQEIGFSYKYDMENNVIMIE